LGESRFPATSTQSTVRINGVLPNGSTFGNEEKSEKAAGVKRGGTTADTSCSISAKDQTTEIFHTLVHIGDVYTRGRRIYQRKLRLKQHLIIV
jgi:hypothetical protein